MNIIDCLLATVSGFAKVFIGETVREIHLDHHRIIYRPQVLLNIVLVLKEASYESIPIALILDCIYQSFLENYHAYLQETVVRHFIDKQVSTSFTAILDTLLQDYLGVEAFLHHQFRVVNQGKEDQLNNSIEVINGPINSENFYWYLALREKHFF